MLTESGDVWDASTIASIVPCISMIAPSAYTVLNVALSLLVGTLKGTGLQQLIPVIMSSTKYFLLARVIQLKRNSARLINKPASVAAHSTQN